MYQDKVVLWSHGIFFLKSIPRKTGFKLKLVIICFINCYINFLYNWIVRFLYCFIILFLKIGGNVCLLVIEYLVKDYEAYIQSIM